MLLLISNSSPTAFISPSRRPMSTRTVWVSERSDVSGVEGRVVSSGRSAGPDGSDASHSGTGLPAFAAGAVAGLSSETVPLNTAAAASMSARARPLPKTRSKAIELSSPGWLEGSVEITSPSGLRPAFSPESPWSKSARLHTARTL